LQAEEAFKGVPLKVWRWMIQYHDECQGEYIHCLMVEDYENIDVAYGKKLAAEQIMDFFYEYAPEGER
jgi:hypothetical protein